MYDDLDGFPPEEKEEGCPPGIGLESVEVIREE